jgi:hypothetical protein
MNMLSPLTTGQVRLLDRHRRGLARLAGVLAAKLGRAPADLMFVLAHDASKVSSVAREQLGQQVVTGSEAVIVPGLATELPTWIDRLALAGPVRDCMCRSSWSTSTVIWRCAASRPSGTR